MERTLRSSMKREELKVETKQYLTSVVLEESVYVSVEREQSPRPAAGVLRIMTVLNERVLGYRKVKPPRAE